MFLLLVRLFEVMDFDISLHIAATDSTDGKLFLWTFIILNLSSEELYLWKAIKQQCVFFIEHSRSKYEWWWQNKSGYGYTFPYRLEAKTEKINSLLHCSIRKMVYLVHPSSTNQICQGWLIETAGFTGSGLSFHLGYTEPKSEDWFDVQLLYFPSSSLLTCLGSSRWRIKHWRPHCPHSRWNSWLLLAACPSLGCRRHLESNPEKRKLHIPSCLSLK